MQASERLQVLCVDDEPAVLEGLEDTLHRGYHIVSATSGSAALERLRQEPRTAVIISDMRMPAMNGATFLGLARGIAPNATRILLTGQTDLDAAVSAINTGQIFRFLSKPCSPADLMAAVDAAAEHHRLITSEKILLEHTLRGSIKMLTSVLSLTNPTAFGRATRIKESAGSLAHAVGADSVWAVEVAAMLSQVAYVALPDAVAEKLYQGQRLSKDEQARVDSLPMLAEQLISEIPRLDDIRAILANYGRRFKGAPATYGDGTKPIPLGARILKIIVDFDGLEAQGLDAGTALDTMRGRAGWYDPEILAAFAAARGSLAKSDVREIPLRMVQTGMTFAADVKTPTGVLLVPRGYEVTPGVLARIRNFAVQGNVRVIVSARRPTATEGD